MAECLKPRRYKGISKQGNPYDYEGKCKKCLTCKTTQKKRHQIVGISRFEEEPYKLYGFDLWYITFTGDNMLKSNAEKPGHIATKENEPNRKCWCGKDVIHEKGYILTGIPQNFEDVEWQKLAEFNVTISELWTKTIKQLRKQYGNSLAAFRCFELQNRGVAHCHALIATEKSAHATLEDLQQIIQSVEVKKVKWGTDLDIQKQRATDKQGISNTIFYETKYITKGAMDDLETENRIKENRIPTADEVTKARFDRRLEKEVRKYILQNRPDVKNYKAKMRNFGMGVKLISKTQNWSKVTLKSLNEDARKWCIEQEALRAVEETRSDHSPEQASDTAICSANGYSSASVGDTLGGAETQAAHSEATTHSESRRSDLAHSDRAFRSVSEECGQGRSPQSLVCNTNLSRNTPNFSRLPKTFKKSKSNLPNPTPKTRKFSRKRLKIYRT